MGIFRMPSLGADMEAGKLVEWMVKPGDVVKRGDVVAVVETQKGAIEIEIFEDGTVARLIADVDQDLPVGAEMALVLAPGEEVPAEDHVALPEPAPRPSVPSPAEAQAALPADVVGFRPGGPAEVAAIPPLSAPPPTAPDSPTATSAHGAASPAARHPGRRVGPRPRDRPGKRPGRRGGPLGCRGSSKAWHPPRARIAARGDAQGDRRRHDALQADDPAFLPVRDD